MDYFFQFTTSQGGRRRCDMEQCCGTCLSIHDLTRRSTITYATITNLDATFQFTTSQGGRRHSLEAVAKTLNLSIHDLTRRSTANLHKILEKNCIFLFIIHKTVALFFLFSDIFLSFHYLCPSFPVRIPWYFLCTPHPH